MNSQQAPDWLPNLLVPFFTLSYPTDAPVAPDSFPNASYYSYGPLDGCLIISYIAVMAVLRDVARVFLMEPFAHWYLTRQSSRASEDSVRLLNGNGNGHAAHSEKRLSVQTKASRREERMIRRRVIRCAEQGWSLIYYTLQCGYGIYVHCNLPTAPFNTEKMWIDYPHLPLAGPLKLYYLTQTAFYTHQVLVLNAEARRKDHVQMMTHHVITIALMVASYFYDFTRVGCCIMVLMDWCDIFLPLAKVFRYLSFLKLCDITFGIFLVSWLITRHLLFILVIKSLYTDGMKFVTTMPSWSPWNARQVLLTFFVFLIALQVLQVLWFATICGVAWRVVTGQGAEDTRSDDEADLATPLESPVETTPPGLKKRRKLL